MEQDNLPTLIVVTGPPGAGKTTLAHALAKAMRCPALCRDELKEGLIHTTGLYGKPADALGPQVYTAFFETIVLLLSHGISLVVEAAFQHKLWAPQLEPLCTLAQVRIVVCRLDPLLACQRQVERAQADPSRAQFHHSVVVQLAEEGGEPPLLSYDPPRLAVPTLTVDTSQGYLPDLDQILRFSQSCR